jgi:hypothetical protein
VAGRTSSGSSHPFTAYGPVGVAPSACAAQPSGLAMNACSARAASSSAPSVVFGMYTPDGDQTVSPLAAASSPGIGKMPTSRAPSGEVRASTASALLSIG